MGQSSASNRGGTGSIPGNVGFVADEVALRQDFSEYFGFPCQFSFDNCSTFIIIHHSGLVQQAKEWPTYQVNSVSPQPCPLKKVLETRVGFDAGE
jgi:hypothetical protein